MSSPPISTVILAGGASRRMGRDKALLRAAGGTWLEHLAQEAREALASDVLVVGRERPVGWAVTGVSFALDEVPGQGPLGGLVTAFGQVAGDVLLVACDMPRLDATALSWLRDAARRHPNAAAVAARGPDGPEPLFAVYRQAARAPARERLGRGQRALRGLLEALGAASVRPPPDVLEKLVNINDPEALARLKGAS